VTGDEVLFLNARRHAHPDWLLPACLHNDGNYVISLGAVTKWLAEQAEALGVEIFPGFAAAEVLYDDAAPSRRGHRQHGRRQGRRAAPELPARHGTARQVHVFAEGRAATWASS
jgi:flavin-dependent dehydrogenase